MALPFRRATRPSPWNPEALAGPDPTLTLREWQVSVLLCSLSAEVRKALVSWLLAPTDLNRWPPPDRFEQRRLPFCQEDMGGHTLATCCTLLFEELKAIRQTLDTSPHILSGLTSNGLLVAHAIRLRQLEGWLWPRYAVRQIKRMIA